MTLSTTEQDHENTRRRRAWDKQAHRYDKQIGWWERWLFGQDNRAWACERASGDVLDVAIGTGLNVPFYDPELKVTGVDLSRAMLDIARQRAIDSGRDVDLREGDAALVRAREAADEAAVAFRVREPSPALRRIVEITGTVDLLPNE